MEGLIAGTGLTSDRKRRAAAGPAHRILRKNGLGFRFINVRTPF